MCKNKNKNSVEIIKNIIKNLKEKNLLISGLWIYYSVKLNEKKTGKKTI